MAKETSKLFEEKN